MNQSMLSSSSMNGNCNIGCCSGLASAQYIVAAVILVAVAVLFMYAQFATLFAAKKIHDNDSYKDAISPMNEHVINISAIILIICTIVIGLRMMVSLFHIATGSNQAISIPPFSIHINDKASSVLTFIVIVALIGLCGYVAYTQFATLDWLKNIRDANQGSQLGESTVIGYLDAMFHTRHINRTDLMGDNVGPSPDNTQNKIVESGSYILITYFIIAILCLVVFQYFSYAQSVNIHGRIPIIDTFAQKASGYSPISYDSISSSAKKMFSNLPSFSLSSESELNEQAAQQTKSKK